MDYIALSKHIEDHIIALRRDLHQHPELSFQEARTSDVVCRELEGLGIPVWRLAEYDVVGKLVGGRAEKGSPRLALRADMDALPIDEEGEADFRSQSPGVMHACGHDGHTAMLLGAARLLKEGAAELQGTVYFCFQSAEEVGGGAGPILDYLAAEGGVDRVLAAHVWADIPSGGMGLIQGPAMAACDSFTLTVAGRGGHASRPDLSIDPIKPLCQAALALSAIPAGFIRPTEPCVVHIGRIEAGTRPNIFPQSGTLWGGIRSFSSESREKVKALAEQIARHSAAGFGATAQISFRADAPLLMNDPATVRDIRGLLLETGLFQPVDLPPILGSENFGAFTSAYPGAMVFIGIRNEEKGLTYGHHHPRFRIDEAVLHKGAAFFALCAQLWLQGR
ncbi:MAG: M20 family metallopeptidase [Christensenellales bacterium]